MPESSGRFPTLGVEEEYFLVDAGSGELVAAGSRVLGRARQVLGGLVSGELSEYQVEGKTPPCSTLEELSSHLTRVRTAIAAAATQEGLRVVASGTPLLGLRVPMPISDDPRHLGGIEAFRALNDTYALCGLHVHVQVPDREQAVLVSNHLRPWLPVLVAMAANSPFWDGRDSGYASWRTLTVSRWPVSGPPPYFSSAAHYDALTADLAGIGATLSERSLYWDVRPCAHLPTVEIRVMDVSASATDAAVFAVLTRALVVRALQRISLGDPGPHMSDALLRAAYWRSARDGWPGHGLAPHSNQLVPTTRLAESLVDHTRPVLEEQNELHHVTAALRRLAAQGGGAGRQRAAHGRRGELLDVVRHLADHTAPSTGPGPSSPGAVTDPVGAQEPPVRPSR